MPEIVKRDIKDANFRKVSADWRFGIAILHSSLPTYPLNVLNYSTLFLLPAFTPADWDPLGTDYYNEHIKNPSPKTLTLNQPSPNTLTPPPKTHTSIP